MGGESSFVTNDISIKGRIIDVGRLCGTHGDFKGS